MDCVIEQIPEQTTVYMRRIGAYGNENYKLMAALKEWANQRGLLKDSVIYGIAQDNPKDTSPEQCRYDVCLIVATACPADESVQRGTSPSGKYAVFTIPHTAKAVQEFWNSMPNLLKKKWLQHDTSKPILERYKYSFVINDKCEFCVPII